MHLSQKSIHSKLFPKTSEQIAFAASGDLLYLHSHINYIAIMDISKPIAVSPRVLRRPLTVCEQQCKKEITLTLY